MLDDRHLDRIRERAYVISLGSDAGTPDENWLRAEREIAVEDAEELRRAAAERGFEVAERTAFTRP